MGGAHLIDDAFAVYDSHNHMGSQVTRGKRIDADDASGGHLGEFKNPSATFSAINSITISGSLARDSSGRGDRNDV
jgi:hypothetical protein